jgi:hypothetical protein
MYKSRKRLILLSQNFIEEKKKHKIRLSKIIIIEKLFILLELYSIGY